MQLCFPLILIDSECTARRHACFQRFFSSAVESRLHIGMDKWMGTKWEFYSSIKAQCICVSRELRVKESVLNCNTVVLQLYATTYDARYRQAPRKCALSKPKLKDFNTMEKNMSGI